MARASAGRPPCGETRGIIAPMQTRSSPIEQNPAEQRVTALMADVERLLAERRDVEAHTLWSEAAAILPEHPLVLHEQARRMARAGDARAARELLQQLVAASPASVPFALSLAAVLRTLGERDQELAVLEQALTREPRHLIALLQKAAVLELLGKPRAAAAVYRNALQTLAPGARLPPPIETHVEHARRAVAQHAAQTAGMLGARLHELKRAARTPAELTRFDRCIDRTLGRKRVYQPEPTAMLFPFLANFEYYPRESFPWLAALEAAAPAIRDELLGALAADQDGVEPYIAYPEGVPLDQWRELNHSRRWSAYFLWNQGRAEETHMARCARTVEALAATPQVDIRGRGPTAFFSILDARTHIPPHTGVTNTRLTVHLPLIMPPGCRFRVGGETREWRFGEAWVFDDTIEHEAWNDAPVSRAILIFDVWNPQLTALERDLVREATIALAEYGSEEGGVPGVAL